MSQTHHEFAPLTVDQVAELQNAPSREIAECEGRDILDWHLAGSQDPEGIEYEIAEITEQISRVIIQTFGSSDESLALNGGADTRKGTSVDTDGSLTRAEEVDNNARLQNLKKQFARLDQETQETVFGILFPAEAERIRERTQQEWNHSQANATEDDFFRDRSSWTSPVSYIALMNARTFDTALVDKFEELLDTYSSDMPNLETIDLDRIANLAQEFAELISAYPHLFSNDQNEYIPELPFDTLMVRLHEMFSSLFPSGLPAPTSLAEYDRQVTTPQRIEYRSQYEKGFARLQRDCFQLHHDILDCVPSEEAKAYFTRRLREGYDSLD